MNTSQIGISLIQRYEGYRTTPYRCPAGIWTVGYGHAIGRVLPPEWDRTLTTDEVFGLLMRDLRRVESGIRRYCTAGLSQPQFDGLVSFAFNLGLGVLQRSTLRMKLNRGDYVGAAAQFCRFTRAGGVVVSGLVKRRNAEHELFTNNA